MSSKFETGLLTCCLVDPEALAAGSFVQLFLMFVLDTSYLPPVYRRSTKAWMRSPHLSAEFAQRVRWFMDHLSAVAKAAGGVLHKETKTFLCVVDGQASVRPHGSCSCQT